MPLKSKEEREAEDGGTYSDDDGEQNLLLRWYRDRAVQLWQQGMYVCRVAASGQHESLSAVGASKQRAVHGHGVVQLGFAGAMYGAC
jgi:hypothetical protein